MFTILLIRPQLGENIGACARAMSNFGLKRLRLVAPRDGWPNPRAFEMAAGGAKILEDAEMYADVPAALADLHAVYATTGRMRDIDKRGLAPPEAVAEMRLKADGGQRIGLMFGPERTGLTNADIALADALVHIPTDTANPSLNLAQSAVVMAYEWFKSLNINPVAPGREASSLAPAHQLPATKEELHSFFLQLEAALDAANHFRATPKKPVMWQNIQNIFTLLPLSHQELRTLRGIVRTLARSPRGNE